MGQSVWCTPFLRWAGSKRRLLPNLLELVPEAYDRYIEPFVGSGCLFFALKPDSAILGDINGALMEVYSTVHKHPRLVSRAVHRIKRTPEQYYMLRDEGPGLLPPIQRVARFIFLNRNCFNGIYRTNKEGKFNVPFGSRTGQLPGESFFYRCSGGIGVKS